MTTALLILGRNTDGLITPLYAGAMALSVSGCNRGWPSGTTIAERPIQDTIMADTVVERPKKDTTMADTTQVNIGHRIVILDHPNIGHPPHWHEVPNSPNNLTRRQAGNNPQHTRTRTHTRNSTRTERYPREAAPLYT